LIAVKDEQADLLERRTEERNGKQVERGHREHDRDTRPCQ
jgi:hypothetical protein